jgi:hypothetical protein
MRQLTREELEPHLVECGSCGKKHISSGAIYNGYSHCAECVPKLERCCVSGVYKIKSELTFFEVQNIYVFNPDPSKIVTSFNRKVLYTGYIEFGRQVYLTRRAGDQKWGTMVDFERLGYIEIFNGYMCKKEDTVSYGGKIYSRHDFYQQIQNRGDPIFKETVEKNTGGLGVPYLGFELELETEAESERDDDLIYDEMRERGYEHDDYGEWVDEDGDEVCPEDVLPASYFGCDGASMEDIASNLYSSMIDLGMEELMYFKSDSSIDNGFEIISHPSTYSYYKSKDFSKFFSKAKQLGMFDDDTCGLHVHVSKDALTRKQWWGLMSFVTRFESKYKKLSRRDWSWAENTGNTNYCDFKANRDADYISAKRFGKDILRHYPTENYERYAAINLKNSKTVEFRLFRSTTNLDEFYGTLGLVEATVLFAKEYSFSFIQETDKNKLWDEFTMFIKRKGYGNTIRLMKKTDVINLNLKIKDKKKALCV